MLPQSARFSRRRRSSGVGVSGTVEIQKQLERFWEIEEGIAQSHWTADEQRCEDHFSATHIQDATGRYVLALPFNRKQHTLGYSKEQALCCECESS